MPSTPPLHTGAAVAAHGSAWAGQTVPFLLFLNMLIAFNWLIFTVIGMQRAGTGQLFTYPLTLPRLLFSSTPSPERPA